MYAVIKSGGRQYKVTEGQVVRVNLLKAEPGQEIVLGDVLLVSEGGEARCGRPTLEGASIKAQVLNHARDKKIRVFKKKRRQGYHKAQGHRQDYTALKILAIEA
ncbi:MAG: 50S ribosomal protein L21 [Deltaproteobacteria bacterium]|jgi:large subunit ribosomal protein L21|nr:50S ribosomal protein L21 [Deltaproteobacteria bacterium]